MGKLRYLRNHGFAKPAFRHARDPPKPSLTSAHSSCRTTTPLPP